MLCHKVTFSADDLSMEHLINKTIDEVVQLGESEGWDFMITPDTLYDINVSSWGDSIPKK